MVYDAPALPTLLHGSEIWTLRGKKIDTIDIKRDEISQKTTKVTKKFWKI
jgi:hypothetical protein